MKWIRKLLVRLIGIKAYLKLISKVYLSLTNLGFLKKSYPELFFIDRLVQPNWVCLDIGANLGYYSNRILQNIEGGALHAVEPIPLFAAIWKSNILPSRKKVSLYNIALGEEKKQVKMSIPVRDGVVRHGLTKVDTGDNVGQSALSFDVEMERGDAIFSDLKQLDFVKIDVEGYEQFVLREIESTLRTHLPVIQIELSGRENRSISYKLLTSISYKAFILDQNKLKPITEDELQSIDQDFYFLTEEKMQQFGSDLICK